MKIIKKIILISALAGITMMLISDRKIFFAEQKEDFYIYDFSKVTKGLPSSWGKLIRSGDIIPATDRAYTTSLTFEDEKGTIRMVYVRFELEAREIPEVHYVPKNVTYKVFVLPRDKTK